MGIIVPISDFGVDLPLTPKYPVSVLVSVSVSKYRHQKRLVSVSVSVFLTPKQFFCVLKEKDAKEVGFRIKKYHRHLKTLVSVSVSDFPTPKIVVKVSEKPTPKNVCVGCRIRH